MIFNAQTTTGEKYTPAMTIQNQQEADNYFEELVLHNMSFGNSREKAESVERENLGYWAGYYDPETRKRVESLFKCEHPIFGSIEKHGTPSPATAFYAGMGYARGEGQAF